MMDPETQSPMVGGVYDGGELGGWGLDGEERIHQLKQKYHLRINNIVSRGEADSEQVMVNYYSDLLSELDFFARKVNEAVESKSVDALEDVISILKKDYGVLNDPLNALASYANALDREYVRTSGDRLLMLFSEGRSDGIEEAQKRITRHQNSYELLRVLALKQLINSRNM